MSPRGAVLATRRHLLLALQRAATAALVVFHVWLLWTHILTGRLTDPAVTTRWVVGLMLFGGLIALSRFGLPVLFGRKAAVIWTLVALLHCHAAAVPPGAAEDLGGATSSAVLVVAPFTLGPAIFVSSFLLWAAVRRRPVRRPQPSAWFVRPLVAAGIASSAGHVLALASRPPPLR